MINKFKSWKKYDAFLWLLFGLALLINHATMIYYLFLEEPFWYTVGRWFVVCLPFIGVRYHLYQKYKDQKTT